MATPSDWCYVNNFDDPRKPLTLEFAAGVGKAFQSDMEALVDLFASVIPSLFESEEYRHKK